MIKRLTESSVRVCCGKSGCPVVEKIDDDHYKVTDDDGNAIVLVLNLWVMPSTLSTAINSS